MKDGEVSFTEALSPYKRSMETKKALRYMEYMLRLSEKDGKNAGLDIDAARENLKTLKATDVAAASLLGDMPGEAALVAHNRSRRALYALSPLVLMRLADKLEDANAPGSERTILAMAKGLGLLTEGSPVSDADREAAITKADLADVPTDELRRRLLAHTQEG